MGAWRFVKPRLDTAMRELLPRHARPAQLRQLRYVGRPAAASPGALLSCREEHGPPDQSAGQLCRSICLHKIRACTNAVGSMCSARAPLSPASSSLVT